MKESSKKGYTKGKYIYVLSLLLATAAYFMWKDYRDEGELTAEAIWPTAMMLLIGVVVLFVVGCRINKKMK